MAYTFLQISKAIGSEDVQIHQPSLEIRNLAIDTRKLVSPFQTLFFALKGVRQDGHQFIKKAYDAGVRSFVVDNSFDCSPYKDANFIIAVDTLHALQQLGTWHRKHFSIPVAGITGSNGKTIVKEWLSFILSQKFKIVKSPKSYNSQIGVPLSVWMMDEAHDLALFEAGISQKGEMEKLQPIVDCSIGIFTNLGEAHAEGFSGPMEKLEEKLLLFKNCETIIFDANDSRIKDKLEEIYPLKQKVCWAKDGSGPADLLIDQILVENGYSIISGKYKDQSIGYRIPFVDQASIDNSIMCALVALWFGIEPDNIKSSIEHLHPVEMRMEMKNGIHQCVVINDAYSNDLTAMKIAMDFALQQSNLPSRTLIVSDISETGKTEREVNEALHKLIAEHGFSKVIAIGNQLKPMAEMLPGPIEFHSFESTTLFLEKYDFNSFSHETILIKGSRRFEFEKIVSKLELKSHQTRLEVNLDALRHNLNVFSSFLEKGTKLLVMVKASGYGSGSEEIARLLQYQQVDYLAVAYADEGVELRKAGIRLPILVLNPEEATFTSLIEYGLEPEIYSLSQFRQLASAISQPLKVHLKLDTGMHRLGFEEENLTELIGLLKSEPRFLVASMFSHLAASENPQEDAFTVSQAELFERMADQIELSLGYRPMRHILNSAGIIRHPGYQWDMVRLGIGMYGVEVPANLRDLVKPVLSLKTIISQIKELNPGESVGYGRAYKTDQKQRIATIAIGYADGFLRKAGNGNFKVSINGHLVPTIGNICMDMAMVDVTNLQNIEEGDEVTIFGSSPTSEELASVYGTIAYEVFTNISPRVKRVYYQES